MKKLLIITLLISGTTLLGFWSTKKACVMMCPSLLKSAPDRSADLKLTPAQAEAFRNYEAGFRKESDALCMRLCRERAGLLELLSREGGADPVAIDAELARIGQLQISLEKAAALRISETAKVLTPEQRKAYLSSLKKQLGSCVAKSK